MKDATHVKVSKREFIRERLRGLKATRQGLYALSVGCGMVPGVRWVREVGEIESALDRAEKKLRDAL